MTLENILTIDGVEIGFQKLAKRHFSVRLVSNGKELGRLRRSATLTGHFEAITPDGRTLQTPSRWSGTVNAVFGTRELAVRALLKERNNASRR